MSPRRRKLVDVEKLSQFLLSSPASDRNIRSAAGRLGLGAVDCRSQISALPDSYVAGPSAIR